MKQRTQEQFELIAKYFELKDTLEMNEKTFENMQTTYNVSLSPYPDIFTKLNDYFSQNKFDKFTSPSSEAELEELRKELISNCDDLEAFAGKLETFEIKLKRFLQMNKKGVFYDQDIQQIKQMIASVESNQPEMLEDLEEEKSERDLARLPNPKGDDDSFEDEQVNFEDIAKTLDEKVKETAKALAECLDSDQSKLTDTIKKEIGKEIGFIIDASADTDFLKQIEINDTKIDKLETQIRELEKKERALASRFQTFDKYMKENQKTTKKITEVENDIRNFDWIKRCDKLGAMKHYRSSSCLETYDRKLVMLEKLKKGKKVFRTITLMQEIYLSKIEDYKFVTKDYTHEKQLLFQKLSTIFKSHDKYKQKEVYDKAVLLDMLQQIPDKEVRKLIEEMWNRNEAIELSEWDPYYDDVKPTEDFSKAQSPFQLGVKRLNDQIKEEIQVLQECLNEL
jgi:hypothetical protein